MYPPRESHRSLCQNRTVEFFQRALCQENWLEGCSVGVKFEDIDIRRVCMKSLLQQELRRDPNGKTCSNSERYISSGCQKLSSLLFCFSFA